MRLPRIVVVGTFSAVMAALAFGIAAAPVARADVSPARIILDGAEVLGGSGDPDGMADGEWFTNGSSLPTPDQITVTVTLTNLDQISGWGIHQGRTGQLGAALINLPVAYNSSGQLSATVLDPTLTPIFEAIDADATGYYLQIETTTYPAGAVRSALFAYGDVENVPVLRQNDPSLKQPKLHPEVACGPTATAMVLELYSSTFTFPGLPTLLDVYNSESVFVGGKAVGWSIGEIRDAFTKFHDSSGDYFAAGQLSAHLTRSWALGIVRIEVAARHPVIALIGNPSGLPGWPRHSNVKGHWVVITGYDTSQQEIRYNDPAVGAESASFDQFFAAWGTLTDSVTVPYQLVTSTPG